jgi:hypothetical protein
MKLKNKKTGVIGDLVAYDADKGIFAVKAQGGDRCYYYSLAALYEVWEDYEEPKRTWYIDTWGSIRELEAMEIPIGWEEKPILEFETKEEAEKAVEKLKAWKRLKDKEFEFVGCFKDNTINFEFVGRPLSYEEGEEAEQDLAFLFGGEE